MLFAEASERVPGFAQGLRGARPLGALMFTITRTI